MTEQDIIHYTQRMPSNLHAKATKAAKKVGMSLNAYINQIVENDGTICDIERLEQKVGEIVDRLEMLEKAKK